MELQLEHHHHYQSVPTQTIKKDSPKSSHKIEQSKATLKEESVVINKKSKKASIQQPASVFFNPQFYPTPTTPNIYLQGLNQLKTQSHLQLPQSLPSYIILRMKHSQQRVYNAIVHTSYDFVAVHMNGFGQGMRQQLGVMFQGIHDQVEAGIWDGRYQIDHSKNKYFSHKDKEKEMLSMITAELVKRNLHQFREEVQSQLAHSTLQVSYHPRSQVQKTRNAQDFIRRMQQQKNRYQQRKQQRRQHMHSLQVKSLQQHQQRKMRKQSQHKQLVKRRIQHHNQTISLQTQRKKKIHSDYLKMMSSKSQKKPMFKVMQEQYNAMLVEENKRKFKEMKKLAEEKKPFDFQELKEHASKYKQLLSQYQSYRQQKAQLRQNEMQLIASRKPYRSKYYNLAVKQATMIDPAYQLKTSLLHKKQDYATKVRMQHVPRVDQKKQEEMQALIKKISSQGKKYHSRKYVEEGKRNLEKLHLLIAQMKAKNKIKISVPIEQLPPPPHAKKYKNYLQQIKQTHLHTNKSIDFQKGLEMHDDQWIKMQARRRQEKAREKERCLDLGIQSIDIEKHMRGKEDVERGYIESVEAKIALFKKYKKIEEDMIKKQEKKTEIKPPVNVNQTKSKISKVSAFDNSSSSSESQDNQQQNQQQNAAIVV